jgi:hypothetical protein
MWRSINGGGLSGGGGSGSGKGAGKGNSIPRAAPKITIAAPRNAGKGIKSTAVSRSKFVRPGSIVSVEELREEEALENAIGAFARGPGTELRLSSNLSCKDTHVINNSRLNMC